jgi:hypothetical protein
MWAVWLCGAGGEFGPVWVNPMPASEVAARIEMRVQAAGGARYTIGECGVRVWVGRQRLRPAVRGRAYLSTFSSRVGCL